MDSNSLQNTNFPMSAKRASNIAPSEDNLSGNFPDEFGLPSMDDLAPLPSSSKPLYSQNSRVPSHSAVKATQNAPVEAQQKSWPNAKNQTTLSVKQTSGMEASPVTGNASPRLVNDMNESPKSPSGTLNSANYSHLSEEMHSKFYTLLYNFCDRYKLPRPPVDGHIHGLVIDWFKLFQDVMRLKGFLQITTARAWYAILQHLKIRPIDLPTIYKVRAYYYQYLFTFEMRMSQNSNPVPAFQDIPFTVDLDILKSSGQDKQWTSSMPPVIATPVRRSPPHDEATIPTVSSKEPTTTSTVSDREIVPPFVHQLDTYGGIDIPAWMKLHATYKEMFASTALRLNDLGTVSLHSLSMSLQSPSPIDIHTALNTLTVISHHHPLVLSAETHLFHILVEHLRFSLLQIKHIVMTPSSKLIQDEYGIDTLLAGTPGELHAARAKTISLIFRNLSFDQRNQHLFSHHGVFMKMLLTEILSSTSLEVRRHGWVILSQIAYRLSALPFPVAMVKALEDTLKGKSDYTTEVYLLYCALDVLAKLVINDDIRDALIRCDDMKGIVIQLYALLDEREMEVRETVLFIFDHLSKSLYVRVHRMFVEIPGLLKKIASSLVKIPETEGSKRALNTLKHLSESSAKDVVVALKEVEDCFVSCSLYHTDREWNTISSDILYHIAQI